MLLYSNSKCNKPNLTLDHFERGLISERFGSILQRLNWNRSMLVEMSHLPESGTGMEIIYTSDPQEVKVILFISNTQSFDRYRLKEKIFSLHINIFRPYLSYVPSYDGGWRPNQTLRPLLIYKRMKLPLGKLRVKNFKGSKVRVKEYNL